MVINLFSDSSSNENVTLNYFMSIRSCLQIPKDAAMDEGATGGIPSPEGNSKLSINILNCSEKKLLG